MTHRRDFLRSLTGAAAALSRPLSAQSAAAGRRRKLRRLACNSWPFRGYFDTPKGNEWRNAKYPLVEQKDFPQFLADNFGIHSVEFLGPHFADDTPAYIDTLKAGLNKAGSSVANIMDVHVPGGLYNPALDKQRANETARRWIDIAVRLDAPSITIPVSGPKPWDPAVAATNIRPIVAYAREKHIRVLFHNDDIEQESADKLLAIIQKIKSRSLGMCPDFGNFATRSPEYALDTLRRLMPYASNICHAKDGIAGNGHFYADDFGASMKLTRAAGFTGKYSLEFEGLEEPIPGVKALLEKTIEYL